MGKDIIILSDYKGFFGSKQRYSIYRGGMDVNRMAQLFKYKGFDCEVKQISKISVDGLINRKPIILYTSSEDNHGLYKSFIEDVVYFLEYQGVTVIPKYAFLLAHNNKVAMELLRSNSGFTPIKSINTRMFGTLEELKLVANEFTFPVIIKPDAGAMGRGVKRADNPKELVEKAKSISSSFSMRHDMKEFLRKIKYRKMYKRESFYRSKFIVQNMIHGLQNDWKVLVYGDICYVLYRGNRKNDFRASGSGKFHFTKELPPGLLDYAYSVKQHFNLPQISLDIGFDGNDFHLLEFQAIYFGTTTIEKSPHLFKKTKKGWEIIDKQSDLEEVYVESMGDFIIDNY